MKKILGNAKQISSDLVPNYIQKLKVYQSGKPIEELFREKKLNKITKLASNENPLGPSPLAIDAIKNTLLDLQRYPDMHAYKLKQKLSEHYNLEASNIILGNGSEGIMAYIARAFFKPEMEILTSENTFIGFYIIARSMGVNLKTIALNDAYQFDIEKMAAAITSQTKVIYIANPNNPTGTYIKKKEFDTLMKSVPDTTLVILDEAYFEFAMEFDDYPDSMNYRYDNVITLRTFSKAYGLAGVRLGYGFGHKDLIANLHKVKLPFEPSLLAQAAGVAALEDIEHLNKTISNNHCEYKKLFSFLQDLGFVPIKSVCNFITIKTGSAKASMELYNQLLNRGVIIRPLVANEMEKFVRISIGTNKEMKHFRSAMLDIYSKA